MKYVMLMLAFSSGIAQAKEALSERKPSSEEKIAKVEISGQSAKNLVRAMSGLAASRCDGGFCIITEQIACRDVEKNVKCEIYVSSFGEVKEIQ